MINIFDYQIRTYLQEAIILTGIFWLLCCSSVYSQSTGLADIPITLDTGTLSNPYTGGTLTPQFNQIDLNFDGVLDIVIFDRSGEILTPYIYDVSTQQYLYRPQYREIFPELNSLLIIRDYNFDGVPDIYTMDIFSNSNSMVVYKGSIESDAYHWEIVEHAFQPIPYIYYERNGQFNPVYNLFIDKPEIIDIDGDGDLDILSFDPGGLSIEYYQNMTIEEGRDYDDHYYVLGDECFGDFIESGTNSEIFLSDTQGACYTGMFTQNIVETRHSGSTITAFDEDGDGDMELLIGDILSNHLIMLRNGGTADSAWMTEIDARYPSYDIPADFPVWLAGYVMDVDHDGTSDLIVSSNDKNNGDNISNAWLYRNANTSGYNLTYVQDDFLKESTIDLGEYTSPKFVDVDMDGLIDIICATRGDYNNNANDQARLLYFRNNGSVSTPSYILEDDDYLEMNSLTNLSFEFHPGFGDLDSDGDIDLLVGENNGYLYYYENIAGANAPFEFADPIWQYMDIRPGNTSKPAIYDVDGDGLKDIVTGKRNKNTNPINERVGSLNFYKNIGTIGNPMFDHNNFAEQNWFTLGNVVGEAQGSSTASSSPAFYDTDNESLLFIGTGIGDIQVYGGDFSDYKMSYDTLTLQLGDIYEGRNSVVDVADIDEDGYLEMVIGNERGGLALYNTTVESNTGAILNGVDDVFQIDAHLVYPNPASNLITIQSIDIIEKVCIANHLGQVVASYHADDYTYSIPLNDYSPGLYILSIQFETGERICKTISKL